MQIDMHYYGTYALALAAGLRPEVCKVIATASQYVDDNADTKQVKLASGELINVIATAHTTTQVQNLDRDDQRLVWVPFHFIPGAVGDGLLPKLSCVMDGALVNKAVAHNLSWSKADFAVELVGVTAHVYADTFSHYGFSGVSSPFNKVDADSIELDEDLDPDIRNYITKKATSFLGGKFGNLISRFDALEGAAAAAASGALGHGGAATYPDRPYLRWKFDYDETGPAPWRDNPATFLQGCRALHGLFRQFAEARPEVAASKGIDFDSVSARVDSILRTQADCDGRIQAWRDAVAEGVFGASPGGIPDYEGEAWTAAIDALEGQSGAGLDQLPAYRFHQAAEVHRDHVLHVLLPAEGIDIG